MKRIRSPDDRLLTRAEVAEIFRVSPSTITRWAEAGKLPSVKTLGGHRRYEAKVVMELAQYFILEEVNMEKTLISVPAMYGDHHVLEVRHILLGLPGVEDVNASSCFHTVEVSYDPAKLSVDEITTKLEEAGYLGELSIPVETGTAVSQEAKRDKEIFFRHAAAYEQTKQVVSFAQNVNYTGRPLWPCPGVGVIKGTELEAAELHKEVTHG
jgi:excisionase family DNA binding protein